MDSFDIEVIKKKSGIRLINLEMSIQPFPLRIR